MDFAFVAGALDRLGESREDAGWLRARFDDDLAQVIVLRGSREVLLAPPEPRLLSIPLPLLRERFDFDRFLFLGEQDARTLFALTLRDDEHTEFVAIHSAVAAELRAAAANLPPQEAGLAAFASSLAYWQSRSRHCGVCGAHTLFSAGGHRALCSNAACGAAFFPRTDPCVIMLVHDGERALLGRQASWPEGRYSTLAGFVEPGETLEDAVRRETFEESGVRVGDCRYIGSQPWPFPASLMLGFIAQATSQDIRIGSEMADVRWFTRTELASGAVKLSPRFSISRHLIDSWIGT
ncbi:MAG: NAD(+) diphosphatase [Xanthomonadales bacterium]|jgi:NAD+ diphosphatase|nr:NAD(+) diphosphatase [Xanthomonadales bacterium]MBK7144112.1 NAD(+) diphosphatase [Xanthomonadales bacterium]MCC6562743.1 NAD(+) diphosphatase [Xanthomonadales bacterium]